MKPKAFGNFIVDWFTSHKRELPWRRADIQCDPYAVWISEVMLQQTQAGRVVDFFVTFMKRFPTVDLLARAEWEEVLECVRGLGYYRRFRNLIRAAQVVVNDFDGRFPHTYADLRKLPGVGEYTAGAIIAFAYGEDIVAMDTNVRQVLKKFFQTNEAILLSDDELKIIAKKSCPRGKSREFYQGMMDYAAAELRGKGKSERKHKGLGRVRQKTESTLVSTRVAVGLVIRGKEILIQKVSGEKYPYKCYEFPGGKIEPGETERKCLKRELMEELGIEAAVRPPMMHTEYSYGEKHLLFSWHRCSILLGEPYGKEGQEIKWVALKDLDHYTFLPADDEIVRALVPTRPTTM